MIKAIIFDFGGIFSVNYRLGAFCEKHADKFKVDVDEYKKAHQTRSLMSLMRED